MLFKIPALRALYSPLPLSVDGPCDLDEISDPLIRLPYMSNVDGIVSRMITLCRTVTADWWELRSQRCIFFPDLKESKYCCELLMGATSSI